MTVLLDVVIALLSAGLGLWLGRRWQAYDERHPLRVRAAWIRPKRAKALGLAEDHLEITIKNRSSRTVRIGRISFNTDSVDETTRKIECVLPEKALSLEVEQVSESGDRSWLFEVRPRLSARCAAEMQQVTEELRTQVKGRVALGRICVYDHDTKKPTPSNEVRLLLRSSDGPHAAR